MIHFLAQTTPAATNAEITVSSTAITSTYDPNEAQPSSLYSTFIPIMLLIGFFYFAVIRPQQLSKTAQDELLKKLKQGDRVVTSGGIIGVIVGLEEDAVSVKVAENVRLKVRRSHIAEVITDEAKKEPAKDASPNKKSGAKP
jgi:preprotein translocase subunit YajC